MEDIRDLEDLLMHHIKNLYAAEEHMLQALPSIIKRAHHPSLKNALTHHLKITEEQKNRLQSIPQLINEKKTTAAGKKKPGTASTVATTLNAQYICKGMMGLIEETNQLLESKLAKDVTDAAIIACVQKMEHYEICTYGTALAYATELHFQKVQALLNETLNEEYDTDDLLTALATASLNKEAEPEGIEATDESTSDADITTGKTSKSTGAVHISERTIQSPGGRAGTSHRRYPSGESRGH